MTTNFINTQVGQGLDVKEDALQMLDDTQSVLRSEAGDISNASEDSIALDSFVPRPVFLLQKNESQVPGRRRKSKNHF